MNMNLPSSQLEAFYAVAKTLSFTKAADSLHISQSALSQRILTLEKNLELTLFIRDRSGLKLTESALKLVRYCQLKNNLENEVLSSLKPNDPKSIGGMVRIGGFSSVMSSIVVPALAQLVSANKNIKIQTITKEMTELLELLKRGEVDYVILDDRLDRDELSRVLLGKEKNVLLQKKKYQGTDVYLDHDETDDVTLRYLRHAKLKTKDITRLYLDDIHGLIEGVRHGLGKAVLPLHLIQNEKEFEILDSQQIFEVPVYLYYYTQPYYSNLHEKVITALKNSFQKYLD